MVIAAENSLSLLSTLPVLSICGDPGATRTLLIQNIVQLFQNQGVRVLHLAQGSDSASQQLLAGARDYDLILAEDLRRPTVPVLWLNGGEAPPSGSQIIAQVEKGQGRMEAMVHSIAGFLGRQWLRPSVLGCILIGGKSTRMGHAKHLIVRDGRTWLQRTAATLAQVSDHVVVVGQGDMGQCDRPRLADVSGCSGPLAGLLSAMRAFPWNTILACACDMPEITVDALRWLLQQRQPGRRAVIPQVCGRYQPLLALYDFRISPAVEAIASQRRWRLSLLAESEGAYVVEPPPPLRGAWCNVNSPEMLRPNDYGPGG